MPRRKENVKRSTRDFALYRRFGALGALGSVVPRILRSCSGYTRFWLRLLAAAPRRQENEKTRVVRQSLRYTGVLALLGCVVLEILHSCSGYAGFGLRLLTVGRGAKGNGKNARRSTIYALLCFLSPVPPVRAVPAGIRQAWKARDRRATSAAASRRSNLWTSGLRSGPAAPPRLDSPPARPSQPGA